MKQCLYPVLVLFVVCEGSEDESCSSCPSPFPSHAGHHANALPFTCGLGVPYAERFDTRTSLFRPYRKGPPALRHTPHQSPPPPGKVPRQRRKGEANGLPSPPQYHGHDLRPSLRDSLLPAVASPCGRFPEGGAYFVSYVLATFMLVASVPGATPIRGRPRPQATQGTTRTVLVPWVPLTVAIAIGPEAEQNVSRLAQWGSQPSARPPSVPRA